jgi:hypothetical protein
MRIGAVNQVVELADGRLAVNDTRSHRLVILDSSLSHPVAVLDSVGPPDRLYPAARGGTVMRYPGDSLFFADPALRSFVVISPSAVIARTAAFPLGPAPLSGNTAPNGIRSDLQGRFVYWTRTTVPCGNHREMDSIPVLRTAPSVRRIDTLGFVRLNRVDCSPANPAAPQRFQLAASGVADASSSSPPEKGFAVVDAPDRGAGGSVVPAIQTRDEWAVYDDGTLAIVRALTYSIDWVDPDGTRRSTPRVATEWKPLTQADKVAIMDSVRAMYTKQADSAYRASLTDPRVPRLPEAVRQTLTPAYFMPTFLDASDLPDYWRAFQNPVRADPAGCLWVPEASHRLTGPGAGSVSVFDIINRRGALIDRVQLPDGTKLVGFGAGVVYLTSSDGGELSLTRLGVGAQPRC